MLKFEICNVIVTHLIDEVILGEDAFYFKGWYHKNERNWNARKKSD
jgi:hypothetical protein